MKILKTENCIVCGAKAELWHGHVIGSEKMALGNYIEKKVIAGFCSKHCDTCKPLNLSTGFYGNYDKRKMGKCIPL